MFKLREQEKVSKDFLKDENYAISVVYSFQLPREVVWAGLRDDETWTKWLPIEKVTWTSPEPFTVGTTRTVVIAGKEVDEYFFDWEEGFLMAFRFDRSGAPVKAFAEEYRLRDVANGCELTLTSAVKANKFGQKIFRLLAKTILLKSLRKFDRHLQKHIDRYTAHTD